MLCLLHTRGHPSYGKHMRRTARNENSFRGPKRVGGRPDETYYKSNESQVKVDNRHTTASADNFADTFFSLFIASAVLCVL